MKNMKKIIFVSLFSLVLILGVNSVQAKEQYSSYNKGDKITVNVNDSDKLDFYVIENSGSDSDKVTAIYESTLGDPITYKVGTDGYEGSSVQKKLNELTNSWSNVISKRLLKADEVIPGITDVELKKLTAEKFEEPSYLFSDKHYWVSDCLIEDKTVLVFDVEWFGEVAGFGVLGVAIPDGFVYDNPDAPTTANIRPVITVSKKYVDGGVIIPEEDKIWKEFVNKLNDLLVSEDNDTYKIIIDSGDDFLDILVHNNVNNTNWTISFKYADGILTYVPSTNEKDLIFADEFIYSCINVISEMKGYDADKLLSWLSNQDNLTIDADGIQFSKKKVGKADDSETLSGVVPDEYFDNFKLDIKNGIKTFKVVNDLPSVEGDEITTNPKTGSFIIIGITALVCILSFGLCLYFTNKKIKQV